jgi:hypothetical protein
MGAGAMRLREAELDGLILRGRESERGRVGGRGKETRAREAREAASCRDGETERRRRRERRRRERRRRERRRRERRGRERRGRERSEGQEGKRSEKERTTGQEREMENMSQSAEWG